MGASLLGVLWLLTVVWAFARARVEAPGPASTDELLTLVAATAAWAIAGWLALGAALEVLARAPGRVGRVARRCADRVTPALARRCAAFVLGVGMGVAGGPSPAAAGPRASDAASGRPATTSASRGVPADPGFEALAGRSASPTTPATPTTPADPTTPATLTTANAPAEPPSPGFTPRAPRVRPQVDPGLLGGRVRTGAERDVVVHRGDSLWSIAARHLGPGATDAEIARAWPQWFEANRSVIGDDPDLLLPGQVLRVPDRTETASVPR